MLMDGDIALLPHRIRNMDGDIGLTSHEEEESWAKTRSRHMRKRVMNNASR
jgi:hypothetical protein